MTMGHTDGKCLAIPVLYFVCIALCYSIVGLDASELDVAPKGEIGGQANLTCSVKAETANITWIFKEKVIEEDERIKEKVITVSGKDVYDTPVKLTISNLTITNATKEDEGNYTCIAKLDNDEETTKVMTLDMRFPGKLVNNTKGPLVQNTTKATEKSASVDLFCIFEVYDMPTEVQWWKKAEKGYDFGGRTAEPINLRQIKSEYKLHIDKEANGTYICEIFDKVSLKNISGETDIIVYAEPEIKINSVVPINTTQLYINWTVHSYNLPVDAYYLYIKEVKATNGTDGFELLPVKIDIRNTSYIIKNLTKSATYKVKLHVKTRMGEANDNFTDAVTTLDKEPMFIPEISINGFSATSVTLGLMAPPTVIANLIHYYILEAKKKGETTPRQAYHSRDNRNLPYMFDSLEPYSTYIFRVRACSDYTKTCGEWSKEKEAATLDGIPGKPSDVHINCTTSRVVILTWKPPLKPNAEIKGYTMELTGNANFKDRYGNMKEEIWGPLTKFTTNDSRSIRVDGLQPNTNYTVRLSAMTRMRRRGDHDTRRCATPPEPPDVPPRPRWRKIHDTNNNKYYFKMFLPRITERNGPICCYRVFMVRLLPDMDWKNLQQPPEINIIQYEEAHAVQPVIGAYLTDIISNENFPKDSEIVMGDDRSIDDRGHPSLANEQCRRCRYTPHRNEVTTTSTTVTTAAPTTTADPLLDEDDITTETPLTRRRRDSDGDYSKDAIMSDKVVDDNDYSDIAIKVKDGPLNSASNYTLFVELIPRAPLAALYSEYVHVLLPAPAPAPPAPALQRALQVSCAAAALVLAVAVGWCVLHSRRSRKLPPHAHLEMNSLQRVYRYVVEHIGGRQQLVTAAPPDMPPIAKEDLAAAYAERQLDSDYGFQKEFEMLPECFPDRTTHASEARENQSKNRYPDIKAYDQTRVKLSQIDSITGSDYINANYVMGYRERKQFICAQGPTDTTVNDFWRMIWEHGLELIVMLTNLEEYSKVKCSKYWPEERGTKNFGNITVQHVGEKRYSDYIVRELRITKQPTNADGQPIVENNGIAKRNGDCGGGGEAADGSRPTTPRDSKEESRCVRQYHFLMWKDFAAPEYPHSILKFIKRVNEAWSWMVGRAVVVHCSAGVGRTGTLVALDCLLDQLRATGHAAVFNTVAELRRQRNFLVQSLKQYVFVYRALVEYAQYGDTEIPASRLKSAIDRLRNTPEGADKCLMEIEFEKMINSPIAEPVKSCAAGAAEELRARNRSGDCLPYDRNRVILAPLPARDYSTYINASFIEAYDNSEGFIITQDPLPATIMDFWRMVSEHNVSTIVMLSELGEGKCPRYWEDGTAQYEHISVQYEESESCPYYTRRQFRVTNNKSGDTSSVRQLQYQGWPTAPGHVPEVTRGLAELADAAAAADGRPPMLVHCQLGTERSALFVALCVLIRQLRVERRLDVNCVARKVRSQRARTINTFLQYEFLHRAILNYAELHNLLEDS
ncbi:tyrosine-protein phosphatase 69D isoform X2 [Galleria mellonella]|uniref:protein-tyrosine-phosphatase n=1 Tax=Galleria mellonella TaxID=7137 RepID=A0ABM3MPA2_GALME|nr:tyrosine-protein phosphatase 69D isoform X2 [Galleria mellonella]